MSGRKVTIKEASRIAGKSVNTIRNWIIAGKVDAVKKGGIWMINVDTLKATADAPARKKTGKKESGRKPAGKARGGKTTKEMRGNIEIFEDRISALEARQTLLEGENESLRKKEDNLHDRIRKVFGPLLAPLAERLLEIG